MGVCVHKTTAGVRTAPKGLGRVWAPAVFGTVQMQKDILVPMELPIYGPDPAVYNA